MGSRHIAPGWVVGAAALVVLILIPAVLGSAQLGLPTEVFIFAIFALTYDLIFGFTGLISFGQALFVGTGAYALTIAMTSNHAPLWLAFAVVLLASIILSSITGLLALRTRGVYFAMVTLAFAQAAFTLAESNVGGLTGGENGLQMVGAPSWLTAPGNEAHFYYVALAALVVTFLLLRLLVISPAGRVWQAIRENEQRALLLGYRPFAYKLLSYVISGMICSLGGGLYALYVGAVSTDRFSADTTIGLLLMVIIGGAGSLWGSIIGAAIIRYLNYYLSIFSTSSFVGHLPSWLQGTLGQPLLIFGIIYLLLVYFFPQGIAGLVQQHFHLFRSAIPQPGLAAEEGRVEGTITGEPIPPAPLETPRGG